MFEKSKDRYLTRGVDAEIPLYLQMFLWDAVDNMPEPKDYLQVFRFSEENGLQIVHHTSEQPQFEMTYIAETEKPVTAKVYIIDDGDHCTMLLAKSTDHKTSPNEHKNPSHNFILWLGFFFAMKN